MTNLETLGSSKLSSPRSQSPSLSALPGPRGSLPTGCAFRCWFFRGAWRSASAPLRRQLADLSVRCAAWRCARPLQAAGPSPAEGGRGRILPSESLVPRRSPDLTPCRGPRPALTTELPSPCPHRRPCCGLGPHSRGSRLGTSSPSQKLPYHTSPTPRLSGPFRDPTPHPARPAFQAERDTTPPAQPAAPF